MRRALKPAERRLLAKKRRAHLKMVRRVGNREAIYGALMFATLWLATVVASDNPLPDITAFWVVVGAIVLGSSRFRDVAGDGWVVGVESALRADVANVYQVRATSFVEIDEADDEGGGFVFHLEGSDSLFFFYDAEQRRGERRPSLDFSVVEALDEKGNAISQWIEKRGS
jgi:hypothetical protein